jgi:uncharacterized DUF497 family protein
VYDEVDWVHRGTYIDTRGLSPIEANEAVDDPDRIVIDPDPASKSRRAVRIIGYSATAKAVLTVIVLDDGGVTYGVNAWNANARDMRIYRETI